MRTLMVVVEMGRKGRGRTTGRRRTRGGAGQELREGRDSRRFLGEVRVRGERLRALNTGRSVLKLLRVMGVGRTNTISSFLKCVFEMMLAAREGYGGYRGWSHLALASSQSLA